MLENIDGPRQHNLVLYANKRSAPTFAYEHAVTGVHIYVLSGTRQHRKAIGNERCPTTSRLCQYTYVFQYGRTTGRLFHNCLGGMAEFVGWIARTALWCRLSHIYHTLPSLVLRAPDVAGDTHSRPDHPHPPFQYPARALTPWICISAILPYSILLRSLLTVGHVENIKRARCAGYGLKWAGRASWQMGRTVLVWAAYSNTPGGSTRIGIFRVYMCIGERACDGECTCSPL